MGGGKEKANRNAMLQQQYQGEQEASAESKARSTADLEKYRGRGDENYNDLRAGFSSLAGGGGAGSLPPGASSGRGGGGGGGPAAPKTPSEYMKFLQEGTGATGGWNPERLKSVQGDIANVRGMASDPEIARRMRGNGVFEEFSNTGGYSEGDKANIRARGNSGVPAMFGRMKDEANRISTVQGGYGPGRAAMMSRMGREQAGAAANASLNTELGLAENIRSGRMEAAGALSGAEQNYQSGRLQSLQGASGMETGLETDIYGRRSTAFDKIEAKRRADAAQAAARASAAQANSRWERQFARSGQMAGLEGLSSLYGGSEAGYGRGLDQGMQDRGLHGQLVNESVGANKENNKGVNWGQIASLAGTGAMYAGMAMSSRELKENIEELDIANSLKKLKIYLWNYKGESVKHIGPMAEEFKEAFGVGDGVTLNLVDVMGVLLAAQKALLLEVDRKEKVNA